MIHNRQHGAQAPGGGGGGGVPALDRDWHRRAAQGAKYGRDHGFRTPGELGSIKTHIACMWYAHRIVAISKADEGAVGNSGFLRCPDFGTSCRLWQQVPSHYRAAAIREPRRHKKVFLWSMRL